MSENYWKLLAIFLSLVLIAHVITIKTSQNIENKHHFQDSHKCCCCCDDYKHYNQCNKYY